MVGVAALSDYIHRLDRSLVVVSLASQVSSLSVDDQVRAQRLSQYTVSVHRHLFPMLVCSCVCENLPEKY